MKAILREDKSAVSEVIGTILILGMTVTLFSVIIVWVSSVPAPIAQTRVDLTAAMGPTATGGGVLLTLTHRGGEAMYPVPTVIYVARTPVGSSLQTTDIVTLHLFSPFLANPSGLLDGTDSIWTIGERWEYENFAWNVSDSITVTIVDTSKNTIEWTGQMNPSTSARPPIFLNIWAAGVFSSGQPNTVYSGNGFFLYANVISPGDRILANTVNATITAFSGSGVCQLPLTMHDDGAFPDVSAGDNVYSLGSNACMNAPYPAQSWSGTYILLSAMDSKGRVAQTRFILTVMPNPTTIQNTQTIPSQLWQYIGFVQIRTGEVWLSNLSAPYNTPNTFQPFRVPKAWMNTAPGVMFHFKLANHGNTTIFMDGWTEAFFQNTQSSAGAAVLVLAPCSTATTAVGGGVTIYPGNPTLINDFQYAHPGLPAGCQPTTQAAVFDINPLNQETGGTPYVALIGARFPTSTTFGTFGGPNWQSATYFISLLVSGMSGPVNYTYGMLTGQVGQANPYGCTGLGPNYNPINHLLDPNVKCRTQWYAQVIPFIGMVVF